MSEPPSEKSGLVLWLTGLSGVGKSTIASSVKNRLKTLNYSVYIIDGDDVRANRRSKLGFSKREILTNNKLVIEYCLEKKKKYAVTIVSIISPFKKSRREARAKLSPKYFEIYCYASLQCLRKRDTKGLYAREVAGELPNLIGVSRNSPYEIPENPDLFFDTERISVRSATNTIVEVVRSDFL